MAISAPQPGLLMASILGQDLEAVDRAVAGCADQLGRLLLVSEPLAFPHPDDYREELGPTPARRLVAFDRMQDSPPLPHITRQCCRLEVALGRAGGRRQLNIDPGLVGEEHVVLASTKPRGHRIHLGRGIYADLMLLRGPDGYQPLPWTYPDYAGAELRGILERMRDLLLELRRSRAPMRAAP
jgi:hypothetical protein